MNSAREQQRQIFHAGDRQQLEDRFFDQPVRRRACEHARELVADQDQHQDDRDTYEGAGDFTDDVSIDDPGHAAVAPTFAWSRLIR